MDAAAKTDLNGYTKESVDAFKKALDAAQKVLKDENATKEQIENVLAKLDAAKKALKKDTTPDTEKPTPTPETKVPAVGATTTVKGVKYAVTKSAAKGGTAEAVKVTGKGKKITIAATVKIDGVTFKVTSIKKNAAKKNKNMTSVVIGKNVTSIGANSFANSKKLANVTFKGTKAVKVGSKAFKGTSAKMKVVIPKKMSKKTLNTLKRNLKKAGISKKTVYKKK
ncbi:putative polysaccharide lyase [Firmicutes bacterium CAG:56]|nr:putative polysaccharide lyase [Firmicutes bacterium CAG:56]